MKISLYFIILFLFLIVLPFGSADVLTNNTNLDYTGSTTQGGVSGKYGVSFVTDSNVTSIVRVYKHSSATATTAYLYDIGENLLDTASFSGNVALFNYSLNGSQYYTVNSDAGGGTYSRVYSAIPMAGGGFPRNDTSLEWIGGCDGCIGGGGDNTSYGLNIIAVELDTININPFLEFFVIDAYNDSVISGANVSLNSSGLSNLTNSSGVVLFDVNSTEFFSINSSEYYFFASSSVAIQNVSNVVGLFPFFAVNNVSFSNYTEFSGVNYTRDLVYSLAVACPSNSSTNVSLLVNGSITQSQSVSCNNFSVIVSGSFESSISGLQNVSLLVNSSYGSYSMYFQNQSFFWDLEDPYFSLVNFSISANGFVEAVGNVSVVCVDDVFGNFSLNTSVNGSLLFSGFVSNNTYISNLTNLSNGLNVASFVCADPFSSVSQNVSLSIYESVLLLINEKTGLPFNVSTVSGARVYFDDNHSFYDFKTNNTNTVNFSSVDNTQLRFELLYLGNETVTRYVDVSVVPSSVVRVCANSQGVTHFEQLAVAAVERVALVESVFADCLVAGDYTRFAYQNSLSLRFFTIPASYSLFSVIDGLQVLLASIDGASVDTSVNMEALVLDVEGFDFSIWQSSLSFERTGDSEFTILYTNIDDSVNGLNAVITRLDSGAVLLNSSSFTNFSSFTIVFDYSLLANISNETLFKVSVTATSPTSVVVSERYFSVSGSVASFQSPVVFIVSILFFVFGLTLLSAPATFGWFGVVVVGISMAVLSFGIWTWYVQMLFGIEAIVLLFMIIVFVLNGGVSSPRVN